MEKKKILLVDDEEAFARMVKLNLEGTGKYSVRVESRGASAFEAAKELRPDLILLDIVMPDLAGSDVAAALKEDEKTKNIPLIFLTALVTRKEEEAEGSCRTTAGNTFIAKPVNLKDLIACIEEKIKK